MVRIGLLRTEACCLFPKTPWSGPPLPGPAQACQCIILAQQSTAIFRGMGKDRRGSWLRFAQNEFSSSQCPQPKFNPKHYHFWCLLPQTTSATLPPPSHPMLSKLSSSYNQNEKTRQSGWCSLVTMSCYAAFMARLVPVRPCLVTKTEMQDCLAHPTQQKLLSLLRSDHQAFQANGSRLPRAKFFNN